MKTACQHPFDPIRLGSLTDMEYPLPGPMRIKNFDHFLVDAYQQMQARGYCWLRQMKPYSARITVQLWLPAAVVLMVTTYACAAAQARSTDDVVRSQGSHLQSQDRKTHR